MVDVAVSDYKTLQWQLNRLACTLRNSIPTLDAQGAANVWANTEAQDYALVGALNVKAGVTDRRQFKDLQGAANALAGTTGLGAPAALALVPDYNTVMSDAVFRVDAMEGGTSGQTVTNLGTGGSLLNATLGSTGSADSNDPKFLDWSGSNYVYLPGANSNYLSVPDEAALRVTGDIDIRLLVTLDDWTPAAFQTFAARWPGLSNRSWGIGINTSGTLRIFTSADGTTQTVAVNSTVATGVADGATKWIRVTFDVDNGASGNDVRFYLSDDGSTWTQLGSTVTTAGVTSLFAGTSLVSLGSQGDGTSPVSGKVFRAQILSGINGTTVLDVDTSVLTSGSATSFTAKTGQTVTINRATSGRKSVAVTRPLWLFGTDDYMEVNNRWVDGSTKCVYLPGVAGNYMSVPDSAPLRVTGDITIDVRVALDSWTPSAYQNLFAKYVPGTNQRSWYLGVNADGTLALNWTTDGLGATLVGSNSTVATGLASGVTKWVRATLDVDNGAAGRDVKFYTSTDGTTWTQLGTTVTTAGTTSIFGGTAPVEVGSRSAGADPTAGRVYRARIYSDLTQTNKVLDVDTSVVTSVSQTTFTESSTNAATVTINKSGTGYVSTPVVESGYVFPTGVANLTPSASSLIDFGATDSFTIVMLGRQWATPTSYGKWLNKSNGYPNYAIDTNVTALQMRFTAIDSGAAHVVAQSTATFTAGQALVVAGVLDRGAVTGSIYLNGTLASSGSAASLGSLANADALRIGRFSGASTSYQDFEFIAAAIFRRALTATEITAVSDYMQRMYA